MKSPSINGEALNCKSKPPREEALNRFPLEGCEGKRNAGGRDVEELVLEVSIFSHQNYLSYPSIKKHATCTTLLPHTLAAAPVHDVHDLISLPDDLSSRRPSIQSCSSTLKEISCQFDRAPPQTTTMNKLMEFGKKTMFYVRVLSGYEERRIRSHRLQLEKRIIEAERRKAEIRKIPEQLILSEVRQMVEEMQAVNKQLEDTEIAINEYFKPVDKQAEMIVDMQLQEEEKTMKQMMQAMKVQAFEKEMEKNANLKIVETPSPCDTRKAEAGGLR
ncbi:hypothetical protein L6452_36554 [Arctium lappa]|uniref:Uncharacterized protein n=1 Tax=Arctium lappa TaxID=4217 RepID=A0ACB8Y9F6_ARCLA|nr:hypothetical protein L6452_36554 [Arctium lappa]